LAVDEKLATAGSGQGISARVNAQHGRKAISERRQDPIMGLAAFR